MTKQEILDSIAKAKNKSDLNSLRIAVVEARDGEVLQAWQSQWRRTERVKKTYIELDLPDPYQSSL